MEFYGILLTHGLVHIAVMKSHFKETMKKKKGLDILIVILLLVLITQLSYLIVYPGIKEVVWLVPNDESCSDIFLEKDFGGVIGNYKLEAID